MAKRRAVPTEADIEAMVRQAMEQTNLSNIRNRLRRGRGMREFLLLTMLKDPGPTAPLIEALLEDSEIREMVRREEEKFHRKQADEENF